MRLLNISQENKVFVFISIIIFLFGLLLVRNVNFMQNDDWVYYLNIINFQSGNYLLNDITSSTFYTQGILGLIFSYIFNLKNLPILTYFVFTLNFLLLCLMFNHLYKKSIQISILGSLFISFNPLYFYTSIGFMTDIYMNFFFLLSFYFIKKFSITNQKPYYFLTLLFLFFGFFVRQIILFFSIAIAIYFLVSKRYKYFAYQIIFSIFLYTILFFLFPSTSEMSEKSLIISNALNIKYTFDVIMDSSIYLIAFLFPFLAIILTKYKFKGLFIIAIATILSLLMFRFINLPIFPDIPNTFTNKGFFPGGLTGNKYHHTGFYDLYNLWNYFVKLFLVVFFLILLTSYKNIKFFIISNSLLLSSFIIYIGMLIIAPSIFDRYYIPLIIITSILAISNIKINSYLEKSILFLSTIVFLGITMIYTIDYINWQNAIWTDATKAVTDNQINENYIIANRAWNLFYSSNTQEVIINYTFDNDCNINNNGSNFDVEEIQINSPLFINPRVYKCIYSEK